METNSSLYSSIRTLNYMWQKCHKYSLSLTEVKLPQIAKKAQVPCKKDGGSSQLSVGVCDDWYSQNFHFRLMTESRSATVNESFICAQNILLVEISLWLEI